MKAKHIEEWKGKHKHTAVVPSFGSLFGFSSSVRPLQPLFLSIELMKISSLRITRVDLRPHTLNKRERRPKSSTLKSTSTSKRTRQILKNSLNKIGRPWRRRFQAIFGRLSISSGVLRPRRHLVRPHQLVALPCLLVPSAAMSRLLDHRPQRKFIVMASRARYLLRVGHPYLDYTPHY